MKQNKVFLVFGLIISLIVGPHIASAEVSDSAISDISSKADIAVVEEIDMPTTSKSVSQSESKTKSESQEAMSVFFRDGVSQEDFDTVLKTVGESRAWSIFPGEGFNAKLTKEEVAILRADKNIWTVEPVQVIKASMADVVEIVGASSAWQRQVAGTPLKGSGQTICLLDTGVDFSHESLTHANILGQNLDCYNGNCTNPTSFGHVHGTHIAGIAAGSGGVKGIAPDANIISLKVFPANSATLDSMVPIYRAVNWCKDHAEEYNINVISMSFGSATNLAGTCDHVPAFSQVKQAIDQATNQNISVVASSGNQGDDVHIDFPACIDKSIAVGATNKNDTLWGGSNYNSLVKLFAPGSYITSTNIGGGTIVMSGTSMAAPVVAGSIALISQYYDAIEHTGSQRNPGVIENLLKNTGVIFNEDINGARINIDNALGSIIPVSPTTSVTAQMGASTTLLCDLIDC